MIGPEKNLNKAFMYNLGKVLINYELQKYINTFKYLNTLVLKVDKWALMKLEICKLPNLPQHLKLM